MPAGNASFLNRPYFVVVYLVFFRHLQKMLINPQIKMKLNPLLFFHILLVLSCQNKESEVHISVKNNLDVKRIHEIVSIPTREIRSFVEGVGADNIRVMEVNSDTRLVSQLVDNNSDGEVDEILFQVSLQPGEKKQLLLKDGKDVQEAIDGKNVSTYSRFVPERTDDYAWENDRVAFRTFGPKAQHILENGEPGGTLTSGIDAWLKKVEYPIINKWYKNYLEDPNAYHVDKGEGYDPYHVGKGRGVGGTGIWSEDSLYVSKNFVDYKTIAEGPLRTIFELSYAPFKVNGKEIKETKRISLDLGSNLSKHEITLAEAPENANLAVGISLHDKQGEIKADADQGWFRYWEKMDGVDLGTGIVADPKSVLEYRDHRIDTPDQSHLLVIMKPRRETVSYYSGFGWTGSNQFSSKEDWDAYLEDYARKLASPIVVEVK